MSDLPEVRVSDAERERAVALLREHTVAGRLTLEEFSTRVEAAYAAKTETEVDGITRDLPVGAGPRRQPARLTFVALGDVERKGRWRLPRRSFAFVLFGNADIDLRHAELDGEFGSLVAVVLFGNVDVYVPDRLETDVGGLTVLGHRREWGHGAPARPGAPLVRVRVFSIFGTADVWRVPLEFAAKGFREIIHALRRGAGETRGLPGPPS
jgi:hypothetical protein